MENKGCNTCKHEHCDNQDYPCSKFSHAFIDKYEPKTNADKIREMSDEELAELLFNKSRCDNCFANCNDKDNCPSLGSCYSRHLEWLQSEAE